jgi:hypothetical protein
LSWEDEIEVGEGLPEAPTAPAYNPSFTSPN